MSAYYGLLLTSLPAGDDAERMARLLLDEKLAACVQLLPVESFYRWDGAVQHEREVLLLVKTRSALFEAAIACIRSAHPYSVPEIVATPFTAGFAGYFAWIDDVTREPDAL